MLSGVSYVRGCVNSGLTYVNSCLNEPNLHLTDSLAGKAYLLSVSSTWLYPSRIEVRKIQSEDSISAIFKKYVDQDAAFQEQDITDSHPFLERKSATFVYPRIVVNIGAFVGRMSFGIATSVVIAPIGVVLNGSLTVLHIVRFAERKIGILSKTDVTETAAAWEKVSQYSVGLLQDIGFIFPLMLGAGAIYFADFIAKNPLILMLPFLLSFGIGLESVMISLPSAYIGYMDFLVKYEHYNNTRVALPPIPGLYTFVGYLTLGFHLLRMSSMDIDMAIPAKHREAVKQALLLRQEFGLTDENGFLLKVDPKKDWKGFSRECVEKYYNLYAQKFLLEIQKLPSEKLEKGLLSEQYNDARTIIRKIAEMQGRYKGTELEQMSLNLEFWFTQYDEMERTRACLAGKIVTGYSSDFLNRSFHINKRKDDTKTFYDSHSNVKLLQPDKEVEPSRTYVQYFKDLLAPISLAYFQSKISVKSSPEVLYKQFKKNVVDRKPVADLIPGNTKADKRVAYKILAKACHPDKSDPGNTEKETLVTILTEANKMLPT